MFLTHLKMLKKTFGKCRHGLENFVPYREPLVSGSKERVSKRSWEKPENICFPCPGVGLPPEDLLFKEAWGGQFCVNRTGPRDTQIACEISFLDVPVRELGQTGIQNLNLGQSKANSHPPGKQHPILRPEQNRPQDLEQQYKVKDDRKGRNLHLLRHIQGEYF